MMHDQQADCLDVREMECRCPGTGFSMWRRETGGHRVAAVARTGAGFRRRGILAPFRDTGFEAAPAPGSILPFLWLPETSWRV